MSRGREQPGRLLGELVVGLLIIGVAGCGGDDDTLPTSCEKWQTLSIDGTPDPDAVVPLEVAVDSALDEFLPGLPDRLATEDAPELLEVSQGDARAEVTIAADEGRPLLEVVADRTNRNWSVGAVTVCEGLADRYGPGDGGGGRDLTFPTVGE